MSGDHVGDDRQPKTGAAATAVDAGLFELHEPVKDPLALIGGNTRSVVVNRQEHQVFGGKQRHRHRRLCELDGIGGQVHDHPAEVVGLSEHATTGHAARIERDGAGRAEVADLLADDLVEIDDDRVHHSLRVRAGEHQQVVDETFHACRLAKRRLGNTGPVGLIRSAKRNLQTGSHRRKRAAQLVGRVADEARLTVVGDLQSIEQSVHRAGEASDLIDGAWFADPCREVARADGIDLSAQDVHRSQRTTGHHPDADRAEQDEERPSDAELAHERSFRVPEVLQRSGDKNPCGTRRRGHPLLGEAHVDVVDLRGGPVHGSIAHHRRVGVDHEVHVAHVGRRTEHLSRLRHDLTEER